MTSIDVKHIGGLPDDVSVLRTWFASRELSDTKFVTADQADAILEAVKQDEWVSIPELRTAEWLIAVAVFQRGQVSERFRQGEASEAVMKNYDTMVERAKLLYAKMEEAAEQYIAEQEGLQPPQP